MVDLEFNNILKIYASTESIPCELKKNNFIYTGRMYEDESIDVKLMIVVNNPC
jgi:hypothetical protein